jgi:hypothetical protein
MDVLDSSHVVLAGGSGSPAARTADLGCSASCAATSWNVKPAVDLLAAQTFSTSATSAIVLGDDAAGASHVYTLAPNLTQEVPFKIARNHARGLRLPSGAIAVAGGDPQMEQFAP